MQTHTLKKKNKNLSASAIVMIAFIIVIFLVVAVGGGFIVFYTPDPNNDDPFGNDTEYKYVTDSDGSTYIETDSNGDFVFVTPSETESDKTQERGIYNFLLLGHDKVSKNTDIMMIISYDTGEGRISIVQIPRDTYIKVDNVNSSKINAAYSAYYSRARKNGDDDPDMSALTKVASMIQKNFGVRINYAAVVDLEGFKNIVDIIGGVYIDVPSDMKYSDPVQGLYIDLKKGEQWLDGETAMQFVRYRKGYVSQDLGRQDAMKIFMSAVLRQVKNNFSASMVMKLAGEVLDNMKTTIDLADFIYFGKSALSIDLSKVYMTTLPGDSTMVDGASVYVLYRADTVKIINEHLNVFAEDMNEADFDPNRAMTSETSEKVQKIYNMPEGSSQMKVYNAFDINEESINIPKKK